MSDNNSLNDKYQRFEEETSEVLEEAPQKPKKEKKVKEKKVKEPKEKKVKEPKAPKEKKVKEKKEKKKKKHELEEVETRETIAMPEELNQDNVTEEIIEPILEEPLETAEQIDEEIVENNEEIVETTFEADEPLKAGRYREEITFDNIDVSKYISNIDDSDEVENTVEEVAEVETAESTDETQIEPEQKIKKAKKEKKDKKDKKEKETKDKKPRDPLQKKDIGTIILAVVALILLVCVGFYAYYNSASPDVQNNLLGKSKILSKLFKSANDEPNNQESDESDQLSKIQIARDGLLVNLVQTDFSRIFYGINSDYSVQYYQYHDGEVVPVKYTDTINLKVDMGSGILNVKMNYIKNGEYVSGVGIFTSSSDADTNYFYDLVVFKLTVLPEKYRRDGHALLLASTDPTALVNNDVLWSESFDVNLEDGTMTRFLSVINRTIDERGAGVNDFCILTRAGYTTTSPGVPFISSREYPIGSGLQDIFVKNGNKEVLLASDIYGKYCAVDGQKIIYLRRTTTGFDVVYNTAGKETISQSFYGFMETNYAINDKYILSKGDGHLYNIATGKDYSLVGYSMNADSFAISGDGRYVVMMGTVKNAVDYQIHIFDLQTGEYAKFQDKNYAPHGTLCFIDNETVLYTAVDPNKGYEYVILDIEKAFEK